MWVPRCAFQKVIWGNLCHHQGLRDGNDVWILWPSKQMSRVLICVICSSKVIYKNRNFPMSAFWIWLESHCSFIYFIKNIRSDTHMPIQFYFHSFVAEIVARVLCSSGRAEDKWNPLINSRMYVDSLKNWLQFFEKYLLSWHYWQNSWMNNSSIFSKQIPDCPQKELQTGTRLAWNTQADRLFNFKPLETEVIAESILLVRPGRRAVECWIYRGIRKPNRPDRENERTLGGERKEMALKNT